MLFKTIGDKTNPSILFFHAMGVTGDSSEHIAENLKDKYYIIMPTSTVYCPKQKYVSKIDEINQVESFLKESHINHLALVVASSLGADLAISFISTTKVKIDNVVFDGGQFAQINKFARSLLTPILYFAIKSLYRSKGKTLKKILWTDDDNIKPYFIEAGKYLKYRNLRRQLSDSLVNKEFPKIPKSVEENTYFIFGSIEDHFKYRENVKKSYSNAKYPVFKNFNHMEYQIKDPLGFARMLEHIIEYHTFPNLDFLELND